MNIEGEKMPNSRVAIIAVHGVGSHTPGATASAVADLLPKFYPSEYGSFQQSNFRIKVEKIELIQPGPRGAPSSQCHQQDPTIPTRQQQSDKLAVEDMLPFDYMANQLRELELPEKDRIYESIRIETRLKKEDSASKGEIHIHELFWSDISHPGPGVFRGIQELYRLLFDLCSLGRHSIDAALARHPSDRAWRIFVRLQAFAEWCLTQAVPITNLGALMVATTLLILAVPASLLPWLCVGLPAIFFGGGSAFLLALKARTASPEKLLIRLPIVFAMSTVGVLIGCLGIVHFFDSQVRMAALAWWPIPLGGFLCLMHLYNKRRPGAFLTSLVIALGTTILFVWQVMTVHLCQPAEEGHLLDAMLRTIEGTFIVMTPAWLGLWISLFLMTFVGIFAVRRSKAYGRNEHLKMSRAAWTANLTIFLPAMMVVFCNVSLWSALSSISLKSVKAYKTSHHRPIFEDLPEGLHKVLKAVPIKVDKNIGYIPSDDAAKLLARAGGKFMPRGMAIMLVGLLIAVWLLAPAVWNERWQSPNSPQAATWLGRALTDAFLGLRGAGEWIRWAVIGVTLLTISYNWWSHGEFLNLMSFSFEEPWIDSAEAVLGAIVVALVASRGPFRFLALGFRIVLDMAIDVANWLRLHPLKTNPRGRISARFSSLLRSIAEDSQGYNALIIVAHSQGTVISADVLRFLKHQNDKESAQFASLFGGRLPIYLFTMGSPLRQFYSLRFPHLYGWARDEITDIHSSTNAAPFPDDLGVVRWTNAFRSGDYIGRCLWHSENDPASWTLPWEAEPLTSNRKEFCIGTGAHTHYWDETAPVVAAELHSLIVEAAQKKALDR